MLFLLILLCQRALQSAGAAHPLALLPLPSPRSPSPPPTPTPGPCVDLPARMPGHPDSRWGMRSVGFQTDPSKQAERVKDTSPHFKRYTQRQPALLTPPSQNPRWEQGSHYCFTGPERASVACIVF